MSKNEVNQIKALEFVNLPYGADFTKKFIADMVSISYTNSLYQLSRRQKLVLNQLVYKYRRQIDNWEKLTPDRFAVKRKPKVKPLIECGVVAREMREITLFPEL